MALIIAYVVKDEKKLCFFFSFWIVGERLRVIEDFVGMGKLLMMIKALEMASLEKTKGGVFGLSMALLVTVGNPLEK